MWGTESPEGVAKEQRPQAGPFHLLQGAPFQLIAGGPSHSTDHGRVLG